MLPIVQTSSNNQCTGGLYLKCLFEGGGIKSNPIIFPAPGPPIKVINAMPELPQHHSLRLFCRPSFPSARLVNTTALLLRPLRLSLNLILL